MLISCCICSIFGSWFSWRSKNWVKLLSISLPSSHRGYPGTAKYHTVWATFSRHYVLDAFSLACTIRIVCKCLRQVSAASWKFINHLNSLTVQRTEFILTECTIFPITAILPIQIYKYHCCTLCAKPSLEEARSWQCLFHDVSFELATTSSEEEKLSIDFAFYNISWLSDHPSPIFTHPGTPEY